MRLFGLGLLLVALLLALPAHPEDCPWASYMEDSFCEHNPAAPLSIDPSICMSQTNQADCEQFELCYWRNTTNQNNLFQQNVNLCPKQIYNPAPGYYVAVGYGVANCIIVEGDDGVIIIDTLDEVLLAVEVKEAMAEYIDFDAKPVKALVYTHSHPDHWYASGVWGVQDETPLYTHFSFMENFFRTVITAGSLVGRSWIMFGRSLTPGPDGFASNGLGPYYGVHPPPETDTGFGLDDTTLRPGGPNWVPITDTLEVEISGKRMVIDFMPGETNDQLLISFPDDGVMCIGDNWYEAFPNLVCSILMLRATLEGHHADVVQYTIRGTTARHVKQWIGAMDRAIAIGAEHMLGSHTRPISGSAQINATLTNYRDAMQYVESRTLLLLNQGLYPDDIAAQMEMPPQLKDEPSLLQLYGTLRWSSKSVYDFYIGWYSGQVQKLESLTTMEEATRMVDALGGLEATLQKAQLYATGADLTDVRFALQLVSYARTVSPDNAFAREIFISTCERIGFQHTSANGRNWYLMEALYASQEVEGGMPVDELKKEAFRHVVTEESQFFPIEPFMEWMTMLIVPEKTYHAMTSLFVRFSDSSLQGTANSAWEVEIRRVVAYARPIGEGGVQPLTAPDATLLTDTMTFKRIVGGSLRFEDAWRSGLATTLPDTPAARAEAAYIVDAFVRF